MSQRHIALLLLSAVPLTAADIPSGPATGTPLTPVQCYANSGPYAGREQFDAAAELGSGPGAFLFVHVLNRNTAPVLRGMDYLAAELDLFGFKSFTVILEDDRSAGEERIHRVNGALKLRQPLVLGLDGLEGPGNYALNRRCTLTLVTARDGRTLDAVGFTDTGADDLARIRPLLEKTIGEIPDSEESLLAHARSRLPADPDALRDLAARQAVEIHRARHQASIDHENARRDPNAARRGPGMSEQPRRMQEARAQTSETGDKSSPRVRQGRPPEDPELNRLLRAFIRKDNDAARVDQIFKEIERRSGEDESLVDEAVEMFKLMLSYPNRYGTDHAQERARSFLERTRSK